MVAPGAAGVPENAPTLAYRRAPFWFGFALFLTVFGLALRAALLRSLGVLVYALDDTYIHMAVARTLAEHAVWGLTPAGFTSCVSSLVWPPLLALARRAGCPMEIAPLALDLALAAVLLALADEFLAKRSVGPVWRAATLGIVVLATPLVPLVLAGMEHVLQGAAAIALLLFLGRVLDEPRTAPGFLLAAAGAALTASRYEGFFLVAAACVALAAERRWGATLRLAIASSLGPILFAAVSLAHGWYAVPNPLLLKRPVPRGPGFVAWRAFFEGRARELASNPHLAVLLVAAAALLVLTRGSRPAATARVLLAVWTGGAVLHLLLASTGWFFRYEAYLVASGLLVIVVAIRAAWDGALRSRRMRWVAGALLLAASWPLARRAAAAIRIAPDAVRDIADQQIMMARFLAEHYRGAVVAAHDIGAISYYADVRLVDLSGLSDREIAAGIRDRTFTPERLGEISRARGVEIAVVYTRWFAGRVPPEWVEVARWKGPGNVVAASDLVSFFATDASRAPALRQRLQAFQPHLPPEVRVAYASAPSTAR